MQIAVCHENVLPRRGGAEMYVADLVRRLSAAGHELHLYAARWDPTALPADVVIHPLRKSRGPRAGRPWKFSATLRQALAVDRPEVSISFDKLFGTDVYYPLGGLHVATAAHNLLKHQPGFPRTIARMAQYVESANWSYSRMERRLLTAPDRPLFVANSALVREHARKYYGVDPATVPVIHNAIDPSRFPEHDRPAVRVANRKAWDLAADDIVGAVVAMNYRLKGLEPLLRCLPLIPKESKFRLVVAGSPQTRPWRRLAHRLGVADRVRFVGHCADVRRVFYSADFFIHPTFYDPCSLVVLEALACGLPVVTTTNNGASELLRLPAEGYVIRDPHDPGEMARPILDLLDDNRRAEISRAARGAAGRWTFDHHVQAFERILGGVIASRARRAG
ncbi:MAG: glycosyltransferase family 4 protein [Gemmataceae bacterium]|nr:glycosyltransferase family 4 protein [Gemmataceae bacterium]